MRTFSAIAAAAAFSLTSSAAFAATVVLYDQDFENPAAYSNDGGDVNIFDTINDNYGNQPVGFTYAQAFTVEVLNISGSHRNGGSAAFGTGWSDPSGIGGDFAIGMLSNVQNDLLGLSFDIGALPFFNLGIDITSLDLSTFGGPFVPPGVTPIFQFTLFDNPTGANGTGSGIILDQKTLEGVASDRTITDWTSAVIALSAVGATNGKVTLQIDLLQGGYAAFDNLRITASTEEGDLGEVPLPGAALLFLTGLGGLAMRKKKTAA
ncbi:MAG: hypothetical protein R3C58_15150 [Parvularculaceae bacterium]